MHASDAPLAPIAWLPAMSTPMYCVELGHVIAEGEARLAHTMPTGDLRADLVAELDAFRIAVVSRLGRVMVAIGQQARDVAELADPTRSMRVDGERVLDELVARAVASGDLPSDRATDAAAALLVAPVLFRYLCEDDGDLDRAFLESVVDARRYGA